MFVKNKIGCMFVKNKIGCMFVKKRLDVRLDWMYVCKK